MISKVKMPGFTAAITSKTTTESNRYVGVQHWTLNQQVILPQLRAETVCNIGAGLVAGGVVSGNAFLFGVGAGILLSAGC